MGAGAERAHERNELINLLVEPESSSGERCIAGIVPVRDVDVVIGKHGANRIAEQRGKVT